MDNFLINEEDIVNWLTDKGISNYKINEDMTVDVYDDVTLKNCEGSIPVQFGVVKGSFICSSNKLTTLKGCPQEVHGTFKCLNNYLTTLEHAPLIVGNGFYCSKNLLTSLKGCPEKINGSFNCSHNQLTTLEYAPSSIGKGFYCNNNLLTSLVACPDIINGSFDCAENKLITLEGCPDIINGNFNCSNNQLTNFDFFPKEVKDLLFMKQNYLPKEQLLHFYTLAKEIYSDFGDNEDFYKAVNIIKIIDEKAKIASIIDTSNKPIKKNRI